MGLLCRSKLAEKDLRECVRTPDSPLRFAPVPRHAGAGAMTIHFEGLFRFSTKDPRNRRSLGFARDDKGRSNNSIERGYRTSSLFGFAGGERQQSVSLQLKP
jgi:hypothetical protein